MPHIKVAHLRDSFIVEQHVSWKKGVERIKKLLEE